MRAVVQRVTQASVTVKGDQVASIGQGVLVFLGIVDEDDIRDIDWLVNKIVNLRIFADDHGVMNKSVMDIVGEVIVVSQFTLHASTKKGNRPSYVKAAKPEIAIPIYKQFRQNMEKIMDRPIQSGIFGADMKVDLLNDGPVTTIIDTKNRE